MPVLHSFAIFGLVTSIYAVMATDFFRHVSFSCGPLKQRSARKHAARMAQACLSDLWHADMSCLICHMHHACSRMHGTPRTCVCIPHRRVYTPHRAFLHTHRAFLHTAFLLDIPLMEHMCDTWHERNRSTRTGLATSACPCSPCSKLPRNVAPPTLSPLKLLTMQSHGVRISSYTIAY